MKKISLIIVILLFVTNNFAQTKHKNFSRKNADKATIQKPSVSYNSLEYRASLQKRFLTKITKGDMRILLKDSNPITLKQLAENPKLKQKQINSIKELLGIANQAVKEGFADEPEVKGELENIRSQIIAVNYDRRINKNKGQPPLASINKRRILEFYSKAENREQFDAFIKFRIKQVEKSEQTRNDESFMKDSEPKSREPSKQEINEARDFYAKVHIYELEAKEKTKQFGAEYNNLIEFQVRMQQASYLNGLYAERVLKDKIKVSNDEIQKYIAGHPELNPLTKKAKAEKILQRAKSGEDFAKLANEFSEDPGNRNSETGELKGGLYKDIKRGEVMSDFEQAVLALEPGQIADNVIETPFGYHIIKLEKKGKIREGNGQEIDIFSFRQILISTMFTDPANPFEQPMPMMNKAKANVQAEKEKKILDEIKANNPVEVDNTFAKRYLKM